MLKAEALRSVRADLSNCIKCVTNVENFFYKSKYTYAVRRLSEDTYEVVFRWRKFGVTRFYRVRIKVRRNSDREVVYEPDEGSDYWFRMRFTFEPHSGGTLVRVEAQMKAGLMADLLGRGDYRGFVEELVDNGIKRMLENIVAGQRAAQAGSTMVKANCRLCVLYDENRSFCYFLGKTVENPENPPCGGKGFVAYRAPS